MCLFRVVGFNFGFGFCLFFSVGVDNFFDNKHIGPIARLVNNKRTGRIPPYEGGQGDVTIARIRKLVDIKKKCRYKMSAFLL